MKFKVLFFIGISVCAFAYVGIAAEDAFLATADADLLPQHTYEHHEVAKSILTTPHDETTRQAIRERVRALRVERHEAMPYLDRNIIRASISKETIARKAAFLDRGQKKLDDLVGRAVEIYTPARASHERVSLGRRRIMAAVRELMPELNFEYEDRDGKLSGTEFNSRGYHFTFTQPLFRGGILWNTLLQERANLKAAEREYDRVIGDLVRDVAQAYFEYNRTLQITADQADAISRMERFDNISERKFDEELISEIEHLNVQSLYSQMKYDYETAKQELELAKLDVQNYLGLEFEDDLWVSPLYDIDALIAGDATEEARDTDAGWTEETSEAYAATEAIPDLEELVDLAYQHRPELQVESARLAAAIFEQRVRWGELLPHADLVVEFGRVGEANDVNSVTPEWKLEYRLFLEMSWNMAGSTINYQHETDEQAPSQTQFQGGTGTETKRNTVTLNLFDGLDAFVEAKEAEADKLDQIVELENAEKEVVQDVKQGYYDYQKARIQVKSTLKRLDYRGRLVHLMKHRLDGNEIQISEYMQAEIDYFQEKSELHGALKDYFAAKAALNRAVGIRNHLPIEDTYGE
ncbi:MAG: TolC family protein [Candidatus Omnitrophota bacterium]|nr:TolC family protein [Candidatus Omnitrophota bacterium]